MSIRRLRTLVAIAEKGSFGSAASAMYLSRSAVSLQMKALEQEFKITLFDRSKRPPALNSTGKALVPKAREIITAYESMVDTVSDDSALSGQLSIGAMPTTMAGVIPGAINAMRALYPNLHISASPGNSPILVPRVEQGELDAAIINEPPYLSHRVVFKAFAEEPFIVLTQLDCPINDPFEVLRTMPFIHYTRSLWAGQSIDNWLHDQKLQVNQIMELDNFETIATMVYHNLGASIVPQRCIPSPNPLPLKRLSLGENALKRVIGMLVRRDDPESWLTDILYKQIVKMVASHSPIKTFESEVFTSA
jgi:DNA-binding transcriptional LysR family regulator